MSNYFYSKLCTDNIWAGIETQLLGIDLIGIFTANKWSKYLVNSLKWAQGTGLIVRNRPANHNNTRNESINIITPAIW